jgi:hypothetical protein
MTLRAQVLQGLLLLPLTQTLFKSWALQVWCYVTLRSIT